MRQDNTKKRKITVTGWLKRFDNQTKVSRTGNEYLSALLEISEVREEDNEGEQTQSPIRVIFWKNFFDGKTFDTITNFKEGQSLTLSGFLLDQNPQYNTALLNVQTIETDSEMFI